MSRLSKIVLVASSLIMASGTGYLGIQMLNGYPNLQILYGGFMLWMFGAVPLIFLYLTRKEKK